MVRIGGWGVILLHRAACCLLVGLDFVSLFDDDDACRLAAAGALLRVNSPIFETRFPIRMLPRSRLLRPTPTPRPDDDANERRSGANNRFYSYHDNDVSTYVAFSFLVFERVVLQAPRVRAQSD